MSKEITGALFKQMILHGAAAITAQKQAINDLNVFPVPDGDTGTNMSMTIATAAEALRKAAPASVGQASSVTASALLQGARGNSGVILSLLFRGLSKALKGMETADAAAFAAAMQEGVAAAYKAVMKPAEGTVLTVSRLAAKRAVDTAAEGADVEATLAAAIEEGYDALAAGQIAQSTDDLDAIEEELENGESGHKVAAPEKAVGFLAICAGDGLAAVFRDLGCDAVVSGGQTMNPSTESILAGIDQVPAETVFVLPNNGNIIMAAQQCQGLTEKNVVVIPSKTVPQGITAMMNVDPEAEVASITEAMTEALSSVTTSQITYAARDSDFDGFEIHQGDYLALKEGKLFGTDTQLDALLEKLAEEGKDSSFISLYYGEDVTEDAAQAAGARFQAVCPDAEISVLSGGQPVYYYIISFE